MKIEKDISDLSKFIDGIQGEVVDFMDEKAREAVKLQQVEANYRNQSTSREPALYLPMACFTLLSSAQKATMSWTPHNLI